VHIDSAVLALYNRGLDGQDRLKRWTVELEWDLGNQIGGAWSIG
jgi:hypothetical protein